MRKIIINYFRYLLIAIPSIVSAQLVEKEFNIEDYSWLCGKWEGDDFGGKSDSYWMHAVNGKMMGMYRNVSEGEINFYQFFVFDMEGLKIKHYHPDLVGWEEKEKYKIFKLIDFSKNKLVFEGLTYELVSKDRIRVTINIQRGDKVDQVVLNKKRKST